ncbi:ABC transporter permease [Lysinibacillus agricola]|uniref:ABC transporter permease n=1 Tax=Lysinibacillus agricola TaxID=2590012 RepID=A0ABX7AT40_9BACI|nr:MULTISPECIES: ABC transporter permease [Lysinibacillus]KOS61335.1 ABC transporter [Lysinibacillus sp. FJAT-14222]QQP12821.1 ABC transporter permease [Lysinibacillus agricola]
MNMSMTRIQAILMKDFKEFSRNYAVSVMILMPLVMAFFLNKSGNATIATCLLTINMAFTVVTAYVQCCLIAEEKEKNTLRSLMLSPASLGDILIGKSLFVFILTMAVVAFSIYIVGYSPANLFILAIALILSAVFYIAIGTICGLFAKTVMEGSLIILPVILIFGFGSSALALSSAFPILKIAKWLPSSQLTLLADALEGTYTTMDVIIPIATIIVWSVVTWIVAGFIYKKRMVD